MKRYVNAVTLVILSCLIGAIINLNLISSLAFFLSNHEAVYVIYLTAGSTLVFSLFLRMMWLRKVKFARFSCAIVALNILLMLPLLHGALPVEIKAYWWASLALMARVFYKWMLTEQAIRHLNPAETKAYFSYLNSAYEAGTLLVMLLLVYTELLAPDTIILIVLGLMVLHIAINLVVFVPKRNIEIKIHAKDGVKTYYPMPYFKKIMWLFALAAVLFGLFESLSEYMVKTIIQDELQDYERISQVLSTMYMIASAILIFTSLVTGKIVYRKRISPVLLFITFLSINVAMVGVCLAYPALPSFIAFGVVFIVSLKTLHTPAMQTLLSFFPARQRRRLTATINLWYWVVPNLLVANIFASYALSDATLRSLLLYSLAGLAALLLGFMCYYQGKLLSFFNDMLALKGKTQLVLAVEALSYLHPKDYDNQMAFLLSASPKKLLRKTVILGLGANHTDTAMKQLQQQFNSEQEEIQMAVIDALRHERHDIVSIKFIIDIILNRHRSTSRLVRFSAARLLTTIYGRKAIPILLLGLEEKDYRLQSNIIELLGHFKDKKLIPTFESYAESLNNRVRVNALLALLVFPSKHDFCRQELRRLLYSGDKSKTASSLYALGLEPVPSLLEDVLSVMDSPLQDNAMVRRCLAWCLMGYDHPSGKQLFMEEMVQACTVDTSSRIVHLFAQLDAKERFWLIEQMLLEYHQKRTIFNSLVKLLKQANYDFHEEIDFIFLQMNG